MARPLRGLYTTVQNVTPLSDRRFVIVVAVGNKRSRKCWSGTLCCRVIGRALVVPRGLLPGLRFPVAAAPLPGVGVAGLPPRRRHCDAIANEHWALLSVLRLRALGMRPGENNLRIESKTDLNKDVSCADT